jgi:hypothetical protein
LYLLIASEFLMASLGNVLKKIASPVLSLLPSAEQSYLSLDIGSSSVKMLEVQDSSEALRVLNAGIAPLPANAIQGNIIQDLESVTQAIRSLLAAQKIKTSSVIASVPGPAVIIKRATFPVQNPNELEQTIFFEAGNFIPESLENVNLDYQILDTDQGANELDVLLVAVRKDVINSYVTAISNAGLSPLIVDVDYFALENMFELNYAPEPEEVAALINENLSRNLGIQWGYARTPGTNFSGRTGFGGSGLTTGVTSVPFIADFPAASAIPGSGSALDILLGSALGGEALDIRLSALEREGKARVVSRPRVVTINNKAADIRSRRIVRVPIISGSLNVGGSGSTQGGGNAFQEFDVGITLKVTPQISSDGFVLLDIDAETSDLTDPSVKPTGSGSSFPLIPDTLTRTASSNVLIRSGSTFVLGGILQDDIQRQENGIPYLRDIPVLGWAFRGQNRSRLKSELLVFVTPKVVTSGVSGPLPTAQQLWESRAKTSALANTVDNTQPNN